MSSGGHSEDPAVLAPEQQVRINASSFSYGILFLGADPLQEAWPNGRRIFSVSAMNRRGRIISRPVSANDYQRFERVTWKRISTPDVLVVRHPSQPRLQQLWLQHFLDSTTRPVVPRVLLVLFSAKDVFGNEGKFYKDWRKHVGSKGYTVQLKHVRSTDCGAPLWDTYFFAVCIYRQAQGPISIGQRLEPRSCANCLLPVGIPRKVYVEPGPLLPRRPTDATNLTHWTPSLDPIFDPSGPVKSSESTLIRTTRGGLFNRRNG